jgi:hypothetical protein
MQLPEPWAQPMLNDSAVLDELAFFSQWNSTDKGTHNSAALARVPSAAQHLNLGSVLRLLVDVPAAADALRQVFAATSADTDAISESSLRVLEHDLEKLPPTVLAAPPGNRVHLVRQHLLADRSAAKAADQSSVGGGDSGGGPSGSTAASDPAQSWTAIKMMELQLQCSTGRAREVFSCLNIASPPVVQIYAVMSCGKKRFCGTRGHPARHGVQAGRARARGGGGGPVCLFFPLREVAFGTWARPTV